LNVGCKLPPKKETEIITYTTEHLYKDIIGVIPGGKVLFEGKNIIVKPSIMVYPPEEQRIRVKVLNPSDTEIIIPRGIKTPYYVIDKPLDRDLQKEIKKAVTKAQKSKPSEALKVLDFPTQLVKKLITETQLKEYHNIRSDTLNKDARIEAQPPPKREVNLIKFAEDKFSATAYMLNINASSQDKHQIQLYAFDNLTLKEGTDRKTYAPLFINNIRTVACIDTGSDLTLMQVTLFKKIFPNYKQYINPENEISVNSFTNTAMKVLGIVPTYVKFTRYGTPITIDITIVDAISHKVPLLLFGNDSLSKSMTMIMYTGIKNNPVPEVIVKHPEEIKLKTYYDSPSKLTTCMAEYSLEPYSSGNVTVYLHPAAPVVKTDEILVSSYTWSSVQLMTSKTDLQFNPEKDRFEGMAFIVNLSGKPVSGTLEARFEVLDRPISHPITAENKNKLKKLMRKNPPMKEILQHDSNEVSITMYPTVYNINLNAKQEINLEGQEQEIAGFSKVSYTGTAEISPNVIDGGLELPTIIYKTPEEALKLESFPEEIRPYIKRIFLERYPNVIALHSLDSGDVSKTLGYTTLRLIPGESLPRHRRIYQLSPQDSRYLEELLDQFIKFNYVRRAPVDSTNIHLYGMSTYLVPRKKLTDIARLVIDFSPLTTIIQSPPSVVPDITASLQQLQGKTLFTVMDLKYAYLALRIDEQSKPLTTFLTPAGAYQWLSIPTGAACSPAYFIDAVNRILHYRPVLDSDGKPIYEAKNKVKLERDILPNSFHYFDDIICSSELKKTYHETLEHHFECLEKIIYRLSFHGVKLSINKTEFAKNKVLFLGWVVTHDYILPDPRRMEKIKKAEFPTSKKEVRSFLGLVNSIRRVVPIEVIKEVGILSPLTSTNSQFIIQDKHHQAFDKIKRLLLSEPLFCNLIRADSTKYLWVDAASSSGCLGAVLAQRIGQTGEEKHLPEYLNLEDKVHRIIYDKNLPYEPCTLYTQFPIEVPKIKAMKTIPPNISDNILHGFSESNLHDSLFWSIISLHVLYNCKVPSSTQELRRMAVTELKRGILAIKLRDLCFDNDFRAYKTYLQEFGEGKHHVDKELLLARAMANALHRPFIFIDSLKGDNESAIYKFNAESTKPPFIFGVYEHKGNRYFTPYFYNKNLEFSIDQLRGKVQIIAYLAKTVPESYKSKSILDLEALAILTSLYSLQKYISNTKCLLLTDSRVLYYLFCQRIGDSSVKIRRWVLKLIADYPLVSLYFIRTSDNLADYLTRQGLPPGDLEKLNLKNVHIKDFYDKLPKPEFTLQEWATYCAKHPEYLTVNVPNTPALTSTIEKVVNLHSNTVHKPPDREHSSYYSTGISNLLDLKTPLDILKEKLTRDKIISAQKQELKEFYNKCLKSNLFQYTDKPTNKIYKLEMDLLMVEDEEEFKIFLPPSLVGPLLSYTHLLGHLGVQKMLTNLQNYYFIHKYTKVKNFVGSCYACFLANHATRKNKLGNYPLPAFPFEEISVDLAEGLNTVQGYSHLLIIQCVLSDYTLVYPLKSKTATEVCRVFLYNVLQSFNVVKIHQDNGPCFRNIQWLKLMATLNIQIINSSANNPSSRGKAERAVQQVKLLLKKLLATASSHSLNWELLPFLVSKLMNHTKVIRTGFTPAEMVFGQDRMAQSFLDREKILPTHHLVANEKDQIQKLTTQLKEMANKAQDSLLLIRQESHDYVNKNRINKDYKKDDIVFVLDRYNIQGNTRPLKTLYHPSPWVVIKPYFTTVLVRRLADGFTTLYSVDDIKKYDKIDPIFATLPTEVTKVLLHDFKELIDSDFKTIMNNDPLIIPENTQLTDTIDPKPPDRKQIFPEIKKVKDEFYPENEEHDPSQDNETQKLLKNIGEDLQEEEILPDSQDQPILSNQNLHSENISDPLEEPVQTFPTNQLHTIDELEEDFS
jgi:hypothetical protein